MGRKNGMRALGHYTRSLIGRHGPNQVILDMRAEYEAIKKEKAAMDTKIAKSEIIITGPFLDTGYEYPPICPLGICEGGPDAESMRDGTSECDECGRKFIQWVRDDG